MALNFTLFLLSFLGAVALAAAEGKGSPPAIAPVLKCPHHDFTLVGKTCIKKEYVQPTTKCPKHGRLHEGKCISHEYVEGTMKCPKGYEMSGHKKCVSTAIVALQYDCPSHYHSVSSPFHKGSNECIKETYTKPHTSCPDGFKMSHDGVCFRQTHDKASVVCPKGYSPDKKGCFTAEKVSPVFICPKHYTLQGNGNCVKEKEKEEKKCPHGYTMASDAGKDECHRIVMRDATPMCPEGAIDDKKHLCLSNAKEQPRYVCKHKNATYMNGKCIRVIEEDATIDCPHGSKFDGKHCVRKAHTEPKYTCNKSEKLVKQDKCESVERVPALGCHGFECMRDKVKQADIRCPDGAKMGNHGCEIIVRVESNKICENKGELRHNKCLAYEQKEPIVTCKQGEPTQDGRCVVRDIADMIGKCEKGFKLADDGKGCIKSDHASANMVCPPNAAVKGGKCMIEVVGAAPTECPHGYTYDVKGCIKVQEREPILECPKDLKLVNDLCVPKHHEKEKKPKKNPCLHNPCPHDAGLVIPLQEKEPVVHVQPLAEPVGHTTYHEEMPRAYPDAHTYHEEMPHAYSESAPVVHEPLESYPSHAHHEPLEESYPSHVQHEPLIMHSDPESVIIHSEPEPVIIHSQHEEPPVYMEDSHPVYVQHEAPVYATDEKAHLV